MTIHKRKVIKVTIQKKYQYNLINTEGKSDNTKKISVQFNQYGRPKFVND